MVQAGMTESNSGATNFDGLHHRNEDSMIRLCTLKAM